MLSMVPAARDQQTRNTARRRSEKLWHPEERRLENRSRQEGVGSVRDGTVSELHPRPLTLGAISMEVKQYKGHLKRSMILACCAPALNIGREPKSL